MIASFAAHILHLSGLLIVAAILLELSANLSIELGRIMQRHWEEQMKYQSCGDLTSLASSESLAGQATVDSSMRKSISLGSMKRVASGSLSSGNLANLALQGSKERKSTRAGFKGVKGYWKVSCEILPLQTSKEKLIKTKENPKKSVIDFMFH